MHAEAEGSKCRAHEADEFRPFTDQLTGGIVDTVGVHSEDLTRKYIISEDAMSRFASKTPGELMRKRLDEEERRREAAKKTYFDRNPPRWWAGSWYETKVTEEPALV